MSYLPQPTYQAHNQTDANLFYLLTFFNTWHFYLLKVLRTYMAHFQITKILHLLHH